MFKYSLINLQLYVKVAKLNQLNSKFCKGIFSKCLLPFRRPGGLRRLELLRPSELHGEHHVRLPRRPGRRPPQETPAVRLRIILPGKFI